MCHQSSRRFLILAIFIGLAIFLSPSAGFPDQVVKSTRVTGPHFHERTGPAFYPFREWSDYILAELDLRPGDVVADIGAGDGWWTERLAQAVGKEGLVYAAEIEEEKVKALQTRFAGQNNVRPTLCPKDGTDLPPGSCNLVFFSQVYPHLDEGSRVEYLRRLHSVMKMEGRLCIIERYPVVSTFQKEHGTDVSRLITEAEQADWIPVRFELMTGAYHYLAIFVSKTLFTPEPEPQSSAASPPAPAPPAQADVTAAAPPVVAETSPAVTGEMKHTEDSLDLIKERLNKQEAQLVDVRESREWNQGVLNDAVLLALSQLKDMEEKKTSPSLVERMLKKDKILYVHCAQGGRALKAAEILKKMGYDARPLKWGYKELLKDGLPPAP